ncbi:MAG: RsmB/NOP family class I SAM-dependent RNA methyltransferase, partial [Gemmatimonadota bacterium]|nr:RsmB/NOP family class I SAM-dependent RNA methyltransferase [Gemmatimonadota bacterium]
MAAPVLGPRPGERVLDLCAAPGGKTTHMADLMGDRGCLVAVEPNEGRIRALAGNIYRTGHLNILTMAADGRFLPGGAAFDRVLVDAPCSAEGTLRARGGAVRPRPESFRAYVTRLQEALLRRAVELAAPGGTILYSTCTFAPEENEAVVDAVLRDLPVDLEPAGLDVPHAPGLERFEDRRYDPRLALAARVYPHHLDSGGLFLARLRKTGPTGAAPAGGRDAGWTPVPATFPGEGEGAAEGPDAGAARTRLAELRAVLGEGWDVDPARLADVRWIERGSHVWAHGCGEWPVEAWAERGGWRTISIGLRAASFDARGGPRLTNDFLRWLGEGVRGRRVDLDAGTWLRLLRREPGPPPVADLSDGYAALWLDGLP